MSIAPKQAKTGAAKIRLMTFAVIPETPKALSGIAQTPALFTIPDRA
jgi:hypothetical protein